MSEPLAREALEALKAEKVAALERLVAAEQELARKFQEVRRARERETGALVTVRALLGKPANGAGRFRPPRRLAFRYGINQGPNQGRQARH